jgi:PAS domain S-box-containing protein
VAASVVAMAAGSLVLAGWAADIAVLKSIGPGLATMKANTALGFTLAGIVLWLLRSPPTARGRLVAGLSTAVLLAISALTLGEYAFGWHLGIDEAMVRDRGTAPPAVPGRMSAATATSFLLLAAAQLLLHAEHRRGAASVSQALSVLVVLSGLIGLQGYVYGAPELYSFFLFSSMALHTAMLFVVVGAGTMWARPHRGFVAVLADRHAGGRFMRPLLPPLAALVVGIGWAVLQGNRAGLYGQAVGIALFGTANIAVVSGVAWWLAGRLNLAHSNLESQHERLVSSTRELEDLRTALDEHAIVAFTDPQGRITSVNAKFCAISGYGPQELLGKDHRIVNSGHHPKAFIAELWQTIRRGDVWHGEIMNRAKSGAFYWVSTTIVPFLDAAGRPLRYVAVRTDITQRKALEDALRASEQHFRAFVESLPQLLWTTRGDGACDYLSPQWVSYTGVPEHEQLGAAWLERLHPDDRERVAREWTHVLPAGLAFDVEFRIRRHDGAYRWFKTRAAPVRDGSGAIVKWFGSNTDIQDLRDAEHALRQANRELEARVAERTQALAVANERIQIATAAARIGIWDWNVRDNLLTWDPTMYRLYGLDEHEFGGAYDAWRRMLHPDDRAGAEQDLQDALAGRRPFDTAFRIVHGSSHAIRHLRGAAVVHVDADGRPARMVGINWDVTEQREAEQALRASERLLREFVAHAPAAIAMLDREMRYLQASERWLQDYKLTGQDIIGRSHYDVFPDLPDSWKAIHQRVLAGAVERCDEAPYPRADGTTEWLQWEVRPWLTPEGGIGGLIFFTQVITGRKRMEMELQTQKQALERSNAELEQFAYVASHDLQEPLRAVSGCSEILQRRYAGRLDADADELLRHIVDGATRMHRLIQDLLEFSRLDKQQPDLSPTDAGASLQGALANLAAAIRETGATITHAALPTLPADGAQLTQLFQNLVGNAIKYHGPEPPRIHVDVRPAEQAWEFLVRDNGIGIEPQYFERIFSLFQRLHTRTEYPGTGIGLAICRKIVQRHGGRIWVESTPGRGSVFHFTLPKSAPRQ